VRARRAGRTGAPRRAGRPGLLERPEKTAERYKLLPPARTRARIAGLQLPEYAVFSGDTVRKDAEGFLYFIGRRDEMMKTSGYRVSPTEVEEVLYATSWWANARPSASTTHAGPGIQVIATPRRPAARSTWPGAAGAVPQPHAGLHGAGRVESCPARCRATRTARSTASCWPRTGSKAPREKLNSRSRAPRMIPPMDALPDPSPTLDGCARSPPMPRTEVHAPHGAARNGELLVGGQPLSRWPRASGRRPFYAYDRSLLRSAWPAARRAAARSSCTTR
jgi:hypothetical protein